jgi:putative photosynthetic complex assembly protein 2
MSLAAHAILFTVFVWWFTTGVIIYLDGLPRRTFPVSMTIASLVLIAALHGLVAGQDDTTVVGAYSAFAFALLAWGWNEMGFLMGLITGPRTTACPADAAGLKRLSYAIQAVIFHELAIVLTAGVIWLATAAGTNHVGFQTFALLWVMRLSAKVNVYLGVPNITEAFLPPHLKYLKSYFRTRPMNAVFPVSIMGTTLLTAYFAQGALAPAATPFEITAAVLLATLSALALVEHWFMVLPIPSESLWTWGLASHAANAPDDADRSVAQPSTVVVSFPTLTPAPHRRHS